MGFIQRAFTPPGTGGREAQAIMAEAAAKQQATAAAAKPPPSMPSISAAPPAPPQFAPGQSPGTKKGQVTATSMLGAAAASGQTTKKTLLGQ
jgi:hypothetical protein